MKKNSHICIGGRASNLAQIQAMLVGSAIQNIAPQINVSYTFFKSYGDRDLQTPIYRMQTQGVFTRDLTQRLLNHEVDVIIHSHKDLELDNHPQTKIIPVLKRQDPHDILLIKKDFFAKPQNFQHCLVFTSSLRRAYNFNQIRDQYLPKRFRDLHFYIQPIRGNVSTRLRKLYREKDMSMLIVAKAAIDRLLNCSENEFMEIAAEIHYMLSNMMFMVLPLSMYPPAPAQGGLAAEVLTENQSLIKLLSSLTDSDTRRCIKHERRMLKKFGGGCHQELGIVCLQKEYGLITCVHGKTLRNSNIKSIRLRPVKPYKKFAQAISFPLPDDKTLLNCQRIPLAMNNISIPKNLFISRLQALPTAWIQKIKTNTEYCIACAGTTTARHLANKDIWVNACSESLGEHELPNLEFIFGKTPNFIKLTHSNSHKYSNTMPSVASYELKIRDSICIDLNKKEYFFWSSPSAFEYFRTRLPALDKVTHCCGPGTTAHYLKKRYGIYPIIFLSYNDWLKTVQF